MDSWKRYIYMNMKYIRKFYGLSQKKMSAIMGISQSTLRRIEQGNSSVRINGKTLCRLCDHFHISTDVVILFDLEAMSVDPAAYPPL